MHGVVDHREVLALEKCFDRGEVEDSLEQCHVLLRRGNLRPCSRPTPKYKRTNERLYVILRIGNLTMKGKNKLAERGYLVEMRTIWVNGGNTVRPTSGAAIKHSGVTDTEASQPREWSSHAYCP